MKLNLGQHCEDSISGFVGTVVGVHVYLNGCARYTLKPKVDKDGRLPDSKTFDEPDLSILPGPAGKAVKEVTEVSLGGRYRDKITGFEGTLISLHYGMHSVPLGVLQPKTGADGKLPETESFDVPNLEEVAPTPVSTEEQAERRATGGPEKYMPRERKF